MNLFAELRRRKVIRVAVVYVATAFAVMQAAEVMLPRLGVPDWTVTLVVALTLLGFPIALVLASALDLTPNGLRVTAALPLEAAPVPALLGKRTVAMAAALLLVGVGLGAGWFLKPTAPLPQDADSRAAGIPAVPAAPVAESGGEKSIAVLPFVNMSGDSENEYFADGISEEILNLLTQVRSLRVAGRTSAFKFKGHNEDLRLIGEQLGVNHILEGSVRKVGNRVRITAQLVKAGDGFHLWSDTYDRELTDIFAVQDEIGGAIVAALRGQLLESVPAPHVAVTQLDAYSHYLRAQTLLAARGAENMGAAREQFEAALVLDPDYVPALTGLAQTLALLPVYLRLEGEPSSRMTREAVRLAERAIELDEDSAQAYAVLGTVYTFHQWRWADAERAFARALALAPNDAEIANFAGDYFRAIRDPARAVAMESRAVQLDPLHPVNHWDLAWAYLGIGDHEKAIIHARSANTLAPEIIDPYQIMVWCYGALGQFAEMRAIQHAARKNTRLPETEYLQIDVWAALQHSDEEEALSLQLKLEPIAERGDYSTALVGYHYLLLGDSERALSWLRRASEQKDFQLAFPEPIDLWRVDADPAVRAILQKPELKELFEIRVRNARAAGEPR